MPNETKSEILRKYSSYRSAGQLGRRIPQFCAEVGLKRSTVYNLMTAGKLEAVKSGRAIIILTQPSDYLASLPKAVIGRAA